jgi:PAS domain S-box-containing protein
MYESVEETLAQLSAIVMSSPDAIITTTLDGVVTSWNPGAAELFGISPNDIIGRSPEAIFPVGRTGEINMILETIRDGRVIRNMETVRRRSDGAELIVLVSVAPIRDPTGKIVGASTIARDVTERAHLLERLDEERRLLDEAQRSAHLGSFAIDTATGRMHHWPVRTSPVDPRPAGSSDPMERSGGSRSTPGCRGTDRAACTGRCWMSPIAGGPRTTWLTGPITTP